jgi:uncharacterized protein (TIGR04141 family)
MKINIFRIPEMDRQNMLSKLGASHMEVIKTVEEDGWSGQFYFSTDPAPTSVSWADAFADYFDGIPLPANRNYYAAFVFAKGSQCYAISYGKAHFYLRPFCDYDFGIEVAKRIADENDIRQTSSRRFQGRRRKDLRSFAANTRLDVESGESVDYLQAAIIYDCRKGFGKTGKFGASALLVPDIKAASIGAFLNSLDVQLSKPASFSLPRTTLISEPDEIERYDDLLLNELTSDIGTTEFAHNSYDLYGVDFIFGSTGLFTLTCPGYPKLALDRLDMKALKSYIAENGVARKDLLRIKVRHLPEDGPRYTQPIKEELDFISDSDRVVLCNGRWMHFNQDYLTFLDEFLNEIKTEETEPQFKDVLLNETKFNISDAIKDAGYAVADKDFSIFRTRSSTPVEAWDLHKGTRVYAVKFGTAQKLGYVCDQAIAVLELLRNKAEVREIPNFESYCLWLGYRAQKNLSAITDSGSIILKQKIETWARKARDLGIEPVIKISRKINPEHDE